AWRAAWPAPSSARRRPPARSARPGRPGAATGEANASHPGAKPRPPRPPPRIPGSRLWRSRTSTSANGAESRPSLRSGLGVLSLFERCALTGVLLSAALRHHVPRFPALIPALTSWRSLSAFEPEADAADSGDEVRAVRVIAELAA